MANLLPLKPIILSHYVGKMSNKRSERKTNVEDARKRKRNSIPTTKERGERKIQLSKLSGMFLPAAEENEQILSDRFILIS
jgi:hypothetical protein